MIINMSGGGAPGKIVTVHVTYGGTVGSGANVVCTNGKKTFNGITDSAGNAPFKLTKGIWTITADKNGSTSTVNAEVTGDCTVDISLFAATINVTYPAGYTCTATNGTTTLTAPDASGKWKCVVPNAGTWTLTAKDGSYSVSKSASITKNNQNTSVTIVAELVIFRNGAFQNGFSNNKIDSSHAAFSLADGNLVVKCGGVSWAINYSLCVKPNVDITPYSTLKFVASTGGGNYSMGAGDSSTDTNYTAKLSYSGKGYSKTTFNVDVGSVNKKQYIKFKGYEGPGSGAVITIYEIVLLR